MDTNISDYEIMAPVGSRESLQAALQAGADSIYFGIEKLNMRAHSASTFTIDDLREIAATCGERGVKTYLTVNTIIYDDDIELMHQIIDAAKEAGISAVIASDVAVMTYCQTVCSGCGCAFFHPGRHHQLCCCNHGLQPGRQACGAGARAEHGAGGKDT